MNRRRRGRITVQNQPTGAAQAVMRLMGVIHAVFGFFFAMIALTAIIPTTGLFGLPFLLAGGFFAINGLRMALGKTDTKGKVRSEVQEDTLFSLMKQGKDRPPEEDPTRVSQRHACALDTDGRLAQLDTLKSAGIIDEKEYREKRQEILSGK